MNWFPSPYFGADHFDLHVDTRTFARSPNRMSQIYDLLLDSVGHTKTSTLSTTDCEKRPRTNTKKTDGTQEGDSLYTFVSFIHLALIANPFKTRLALLPRRTSEHLCQRP